jgi:hypothetical protein
MLRGKPIPLYTVKTKQNKKYDQIILKILFYTLEYKLEDTKEV